MTAAASQLQPENIVRLYAINAERRELRVRLDALDQEEHEILTGKQFTEKPIPLTFGKKIITWKGGALPIKGKGYKFVQALYEADGMEHDIPTIEEIVWRQEISGESKVVIKHNTFRVALCRLAETLERADFPYRLFPVMSEEKIEIVERAIGKKPTTKRIQSEIIGVRLGVTEKRKNVTAD
jgi:hypothetical protein